MKHICQINIGSPSSRTNYGRLYNTVWSNGSNESTIQNCCFICEIFSFSLWNGATYLLYWLVALPFGWFQWQKYLLDFRSHTFADSGRQLGDWMNISAIVFGCVFFFLNLLLHLYLCIYSRWLAGIFLFICPNIVLKESRETEVYYAVELWCLWMEKQTPVQIYCFYHSCV